MNHGEANLNKAWGKHHLLLKSRNGPSGGVQDPYPLYIPKVAKGKRVSELYTGKVLQIVEALASSTDKTEENCLHNPLPTEVSSHSN